MRPQPPRAAKGLTLIELIIAGFLGLLLSSLVIYLYLGQQQNYRYNIALLQIQEQGRLISHLLVADIHQAGSIGCVPLSAIPPLYIAPSRLPLADAYAVFGLRPADARLTQFLPSSVISRLSKNSDILVIARAGQPRLLVQPVTDKNAIIVQAKGSYAAGDQFIITDCRHAEVVSVDKVIRGRAVQLFPIRPLTYDYPLGTSLVGPHANCYFIATTGRVNAQGDPITALYHKDLYGPPHTPDEVVEGISQLRLRFGVRMAGRQDLHYLSMAQMSSRAKWSDVRLVQADFLLSSLEAAYSVRKTFIFQKGGGQPNDRRMYHEWEVAAVIRTRA